MLNSWIDLKAPSSSEVREACEKLNLPWKDVFGAVTPGQLPELKKLPQNRWMIVLRCSETTTGNTKAADLRKLTTKILLMVSTQPREGLLTVHREPLPLLDQVKKSGAQNVSELIYEITRRSLESFRPMIRESEDLISQADRGLIPGSKHPMRVSHLLPALHRTGRALSSLKRVLNQTEEVVSEYSALMPPALVNDLERLVTRQADHVAELADEVRQLMALYLAIASYRTAEVTRVLTVVSAVFLPLMVVASVYGTNFDFIPGWHHAVGVWFMIGTMVLIAAGTITWFYRRGWLR